jgi:hypothetical protein
MSTKSKKPAKKPAKKCCEKSEVDPVLLTCAVADLIEAVEDIEETLEALGDVVDALNNRITKVEGEVVTALVEAKNAAGIAHEAYRDANQPKAPAWALQPVTCMATDASRWYWDAGKATSSKV